MATGLWGAALAQTAPAEIPATTGAETPAPRAEAGTYLAARAAGIAADLPVAADYFARALDRDPTNPRLLEGALSANLGLGRLEEARALADRMIEAGIDSPTANLTRAVSFAGQEDWRALLSDLEAGRSAGPLVDGLERAWAWAGLGDDAAAQSAFDELAAAPGMRAFGLYHKALALAVSGDLAGAEAILALPESDGMQRSRRSLLAHVQVLGALGRAEDALALLDSVPALASDAALIDIRAQLEAGEPMEFTMIASPAEGLGEAYLNIAALLAEGEDAAVALLYTRASLLLNPAEAEAALLAAGLLKRLEQPVLAREVYGLVPPDHPAHVAAELGRARVLRSEDEEAAALEVLSSLAQRGDSGEVQSALGDLLRSMERWAEAEAAYDEAIALQDADSSGLWYLHFMRALAREAQNDWTGTEADLRRALEINPEQPQVLNHLGYSLVERGEKLPEALSLLEQAVALRPDSGAIVDSLGWAFFKLGRYPQAVTELENASSLLPTDPVINDHLGDAYWAVGRQREARFQWSRALSLEPTPEDAETIRLKLAEGLALPPVAAEAASLPLDASGG